jgi:hypothetical protein
MCPADSLCSQHNQHDGSTAAVAFIEDRTISEVALHMLIPPFKRAKPARLRRHPKPCRDSQRTRRERPRLPHGLRSNGLVDLPQVAFGIGKVRRA